jgi:O-antigen ligase
MSALLVTASSFEDAHHTGGPVNGPRIVLVAPSLARRVQIFLLVGLTLAASDLIRLGSFYSPLTPQTIYIRYAIVVTTVALLCLTRRSARAGGMAWTDLAWIAYGAAVTLSGCVNGDVKSIATGLWMMIGVRLVFGRALPRALGRQGIPVLAAALVTAGLPYLLYSVLFCPMEFPYRGVVANPNSLGVIGAGMTTGFIAMLVATQHSKRPWLRLLLSLASLTTGAFVIASGSRTSFIAVASVALVAVMAICSTGMSRPGRLLGIMLVCAIGALIFFVIARGQTPDSVANMLAKFNNPRASMLNHRDDIWSMAWAEMTILGHGPEYNQGGNSAHNSIVEALGNYGLLAALAAIAIAISSIYTVFLYYLTNRRKETHALTPALITVCFWMLSMGEGMMAALGGAINLSFFFAVGLISCSAVRGPDRRSS